jgi:hypothetical protein
VVGYGKMWRRRWVVCRKVSRVDIVGEYRDKCNVNSGSEEESIAFA